MLIDLAESFNQVPVELNRVFGSELLWRNTNFHSDLSDAQFADSYSWVTKNNFLLDKSKVDLGIAKIMQAERYGGFGLGVNGGGARVVNGSSVQIKGVGANALAGDGSPKSHSYGGLDIQGAVKEVIYSRLLSRISPVGSQAIHGLILLDETSALHNNDNAPSVLLVREPVARPGHFLPCVNFRVKPEYSTLMRSDYSRILGIYKNIGKHALVSEFYALVQSFLDKCADQLSFFRMARLAHNALAPSNICLDGRVLDTALCSFVVSGSNYGQVTSYFEEVATPVLIAKEWFYLVNKFSGDEPVEEHFLKLYEDKFYQYACVNMGFLFGLDREMSTKLSCTNEWRKVSSRLISLLSMGSPIKTSILPTVDAPDFVNDILTVSIYSALHGREVKASKFLGEFTQDLKALLAVMASSLVWHGQDEKNFNKSFAIQTIKRAILSSYFFITYIGRTVDNNYASGGIENTANLIGENDHIIDWIYENLLFEGATIYSGNGVLIKYSSLQDDYLFRDRDGGEMRFKDVRSLRYVVDAKKGNYVIQDYDFYPYISRLFALLDEDATNSFNGVKNVFC